MNVKALVLTGFGINCDRETEYALTRAGATAERVHLNDIVAQPERLQEYHILAVPGGFSFGDDVASGRILANRLRYKLGAPLKEFVQAGKLVIGICNGFQVLTKMGLLPLFGDDFKQEVTLAWNDTSRFENRWVSLAVDPATPCVWLKGITQFDLPIRHGEGKFIPRDDEVLTQLQAGGQVALRYVRPDGTAADGEFPFNPNGAVDDVAGICDPSGRIFGLMPHPEAFVERCNHPLWTREAEITEGVGLKLFENAVAYVTQTLS